MPRGLVLPPLEQALVVYLRGCLDVHVGTRVPKPRPEQFVMFGRMGGSKRNLVQTTPNVFFQVWGSGDADNTYVHPWELTKATWEALAASDEADPNSLPGVSIMRVELTDPVELPDEATGTPRYTFIYMPTINLN